jgi:D-inositol-3-phosphate glycosyltransferase
MSKRIAMVSYHTCPLASQEGKESGGMNVFVLELSRAMVAQGYLVDIYTRIQDTISPEYVEYEKNLRVIHLPAGPKKHIDKKKLIKYIDTFTNAMNRYIVSNKLNYDVIHSHYFLSGLIALKLKNNYSFKQSLVTTFHTLALMKNLVARSVEERESQFRIDTEFNLINESDVITASSENDLEYLINLYNAPKNKIKIVHPGVNSHIFKPISKDIALEYIQSVTKNKIILFVGRIEPLKGVDVLMHAIKILQTRKPNLKLCLLIVGGGEKESGHDQTELLRLKQLQKTLAISPIVGYVSQRHQHELPYYYNAAEMLVMPSHYESFGMTALEAMACGTPVIITSATGISSVIDQEFKSLVISANNPLQLAEQIEKVAINKTFKAYYQSHVQKIIRQLTWQSSAKKMGKIYENL